MTTRCFVVLAGGLCYSLAHGANVTCDTELGGTKLYDYTVKDLADQDFNLSSLQGKVVLLVNVASF